MSPDAWTFLGIMSTGLVTLSGIIVSYFKTRQAGDNTSDQVEEVRRLAAPTGNGFADKMERSLDRIERAIDNLTAGLGRTEQAVFTHLSDHARQNIEKGNVHNAMDKDSN